MSKFSRDLDDSLAKRVREIAKEVGLSNYVNIEPIEMASKKEIGTVIKGNEITSLFTGDDSLIAVALNENAFRRVDTTTQDMWIRGLINQIVYDIDKDKITIKKPEIQIDLGLYRQYGDVAVQKAELAILTLQQIADEEEAMKATKKKK